MRRSSNAIEEIVIREFDPEFDERRRIESDGASVVRAENSRLIVNPFLTAAGYVAWFWIARSVWTRPVSPLTLSLLLLGLGLLPFLLRYHCVDCGAEGTYLRAARHRCRAIALRERSGKYRGRWPTREAQLRFWVWVLASASILLFVVTATRP